MHTGSQPLRTAILAAILTLATLAFTQGSEPTSAPGNEPDVRFILRTAQIDGGMGFIGAGGEIDRVINPRLTVTEGDTVEIVLLNGDGHAHYLIVEELAIGAAGIQTVGDRTTITFVADRSGTFWYSCALASHWKAGMLGELVIEPDQGETL